MMSACHVKRDVRNAFFVSCILFYFYYSMNWDNMTKCTVVDSLLYILQTIPSTVCPVLMDITSKKLLNELPELSTVLSVPDL